jgi:phosphate ABC transporter phosphate-binding protein
MGVVFLGRSVSGRLLAIKVIRPELVTDDAFRARFRLEVAAARQVSGAFTAPVVDADTDAEQPWLATLFVPGPSLHQRVAEEGPLPEGQVRGLAAGLVEALRDIHRVGLIHRDLKPGNVLLAEDGPRVIDFGIARATAADPLTRTGVVVGTPAFMAPEQFRTGAVGPAGDVFALGSVLVYAATGHAPFDGEGPHGIGFRVVYEEPDLTGLAEGLRPLVEPCLSKDPAARPTVDELLASLSAAPAREPSAEPESRSARSAAPHPDPATRDLRRAAPRGEFGPVVSEPARPSVALPRRKRAALVAAAVLVVASLAVTVPLLADGSGQATGSAAGGRATGSSASAADFSCAGANGTLMGSGSSALNTAMRAWITGFQQACPSTTVNYNPTGAGAAFLTFLDRTTAFATSDLTLDASEVQQSEKRCANGAGRAVDLPLAATPLAVAYNLPGVAGLVLDASTLAKIFDSRIDRWNDAAIRKLNPGVELPSTAIQAFHRADESYTTRVFAGYLAAVAPHDWTYGADTAWPAGGQSATGSSAMYQQVAAATGSIGYLDLASAGQLDTVRLDTGAAEPVTADAAGSTKALASAKAGGDGGALAVVLDPTTPAKGAYPITLVGYAVVCDKGNDSATLKTLRAFLSYATSTPGQQALAAQGYAPLPGTLAERVHSVVRTLG